MIFIGLLLIILMIMMIIIMMMINKMSVSKLNFFVSKLKFWLDYAIIWSIKMYYDIYENNKYDIDDGNDDDNHDGEGQIFYWVDGKMMPMELLTLGLVIVNVC